MFMTNSSDIGLSCDVCGRVVQGITFMNGMKFCAKCHQETFGNNYSQTDVINAQCIEHLLKENAQLKEEVEILKDNYNNLLDLSQSITVDVLTRIRNQIKKEKNKIFNKLRDRFQNIEFNCDTDFNSVFYILREIEQENENNEQ